jgi:hypothetical protein
MRMRFIHENSVCMRAWMCNTTIDKQKKKEGREKMIFDKGKNTICINIQ